MKSSKDYQRSPMALLLIGPPGGGKTALALQFPGVYIADCDMNLDGPKRYLKSKGKESEFFYNSITIDDNGVEVDPEKRWNRLIQCCFTAVKDPQVKTVVIDSLTMVNEHLIRHTMNTQKVSEMRIQDWRPFRSDLMKLISAVRLTKKDSIFVAHAEIHYDKQGAIDRFGVSVSSRLADIIAYLFTDCWRCEVKPGPANKPKAVLRTQPEGRWEFLKNSLGLPPDIDDVNYEKLKPFLNLGV